MERAPDRQWVAYWRLVLATVVMLVLSSLATTGFGFARRPPPWGLAETICAITILAVAYLIRGGRNWMYFVYGVGSAHVLMYVILRGPRSGVDYRVLLALLFQAGMGVACCLTQYLPLPKGKPPDPTRCIKCGYRLYGLTKSRCPECGSRFDHAPPPAPQSDP